MFQVGPDADLMNKLSCSLPDPEEEASDEAKGDSRASPMYPRSKQSVKPKKQVSFHTTAFVVLIPTVKEYHDAGLGDLLWWNECDFHQFKLSAAKDVKEFMKTVPTLEPKKALKLYFQTFMDILLLPRKFNQHQYLKQSLVFLSLKLTLQRKLKLQIVKKKGRKKKCTEEKVNYLQSSLRDMIR